MNQLHLDHHDANPEPLTAQTISQLRAELGDLAELRKTYASSENSGDAASKFQSAVTFCKSLEAPLLELLAVTSLTELEADDLAFGVFALLQRKGWVHRTDLLILLTGGIALRDKETGSEFFGMPSSELRTRLEKHRSTYVEDLESIGVCFDDDDSEEVPVVEAPRNAKTQPTTSTELTKPRREFLEATLSRPAKAAQIHEAAAHVRQQAAALVRDLKQALQTANEGRVSETVLSAWGIPLLGEDHEYQVVTAEDGENIIVALKSDTVEEWSYAQDQKAWVPMMIGIPNIQLLIDHYESGSMSVAEFRNDLHYRAISIPEDFDSNGVISRERVDRSEDILTYRDGTGQYEYDAEEDIWRRSLFGTRTMQCPDWAKDDEDDENQDYREALTFMGMSPDGKTAGSFMRHKDGAEVEPEPIEWLIDPDGDEADQDSKKKRLS